LCSARNATCARAVCAAHISTSACTVCTKCRVGCACNARLTYVHCLSWAAGAAHMNYGVCLSRARCISVCICTARAAYVHRSVCAACARTILLALAPRAICTADGWLHAACVERAPVNVCRCAFSCVASAVCIQSQENARRAGYVNARVCVRVMWNSAYYAPAVNIRSSARAVSSAMHGVHAPRACCVHACMCMRGAPRALLYFLRDCIIRARHGACC
jgi:hypothetical protein